MHGTQYEADFAADFAQNDFAGNGTAYRAQVLYNPMYFLTVQGSSTSAHAWRIHSGIFQGDTAVCTEANLALALRRILPAQNVQFQAVWGQYHVEAESSGTAEENFISWVNEWCAR